MIPKELLKKIRQIEIRTRRLVADSLAGQYHSAFKGVGMDFDEVREYQPGDEVRTIDWNVTARMNHPFVKKFREERELTVMVMVDVSASGLFGSGSQSKRELAAELASVLAFSAIRNQDRVGLVLFTETVEHYLPPQKGRRHVLRVVRDILCHEPRFRGTSINGALEFARRILPHRAIVVLVSDFLAETNPSRNEIMAHLKRRVLHSETLGRISAGVLRQVARRHDVVAVQVVDPFEMVLPKLGRLLLQDSETGEVVEVNTSDERRLHAFSARASKTQEELDRLFGSCGVDALRVRTDQPYERALSDFFDSREKRRGR
jgi:uncharacterized protein (DUF58 family)